MVERSKMVSEPGMKKDKSWKKRNLLRFATWNVQGIGHKDEQLDEILSNAKITIAAISETKKKLRGSKYISNYIQLYSGVNREERVRSGIILMIHSSLKENIETYIFHNDRIIQVRMKLFQNHFTIIGIYAQMKEKRRKVKNSIVNYKVYLIKLSKQITSLSLEI